MASHPENSSPASDQARSPWLFVVVGIIIVGIFAFLLLRPIASSGGTSPTSSPAAVSPK